MRYLFTVFILLSLGGCTITGNHYLRNLSDETVSISLIATSNIAPARISSPIFKFSNEVIEVNRKSYKKMENDLPFEVVSDNEITLKLPPTSTIYLGDGSNIDPYLFEEIVIRRNGKSEVINLNSTQKFKTRRAGLFRYVAYLDIE